MVDDVEFEKPRQQVLEVVEVAEAGQRLEGVGSQVRPRQRAKRPDVESPLRRVEFAVRTGVDALLQGIRLERLVQRRQGAGEIPAVEAGVASSP